MDFKKGFFDKAKKTKKAPAKKQEAPPPAAALRKLMQTQEWTEGDGDDAAVQARMASEANTRLTKALELVEQLDAEEAAQIKAFLACEGSADECTELLRLCSTKGNAQLAVWMAMQRMLGSDQVTYDLNARWQAGSAGALNPNAGNGALLYAADVHPIADELLTEMYCLLAVVEKVLAQAGVEYWLGAGTLVGHIRCQGILSWDDDVDIYAKAADEEALLKLVPTLIKHNLILAKGYANYRITPRYTHSMLCNRSTTPPTAYGYPFIDVFLMSPRGDANLQQSPSVHGGRATRLWPNDTIPAGVACSAVHYGMFGDGVRVRSAAPSVDGSVQTAIESLYGTADLARFAVTPSMSHVDAKKRFYPFKLDLKHCPQLQATLPVSTPMKDALPAMMRKWGEREQPASASTAPPTPLPADVENVLRTMRQSRFAQTMAAAMREAGHPGVVRGTTGDRYNVTLAVVARLLDPGADADRGKGSSTDVLLRMGTAAHEKLVRECATALGQADGAPLAKQEAAVARAAAEVLVHHYPAAAAAAVAATPADSCEAEVAPEPAEA